MTESLRYFGQMTKMSVANKTD